MQINEIYDLTAYILNKDVHGRQMKSADFNSVCKAVNIDLFKTKYGLPEDYRPGQPFPRQAWELTQKITDDLRRCKVRMGGTNPMLAVNSDGMATIPSDYIHYSSIRVRYISARSGIMWGMAEVVQDESDRLSNPNRTPTKKRPIAIFYADHIQFYPIDKTYVDFTYIRMPETPYYATTIDITTDTENYDSANSTDLEWPEDMHMDFVRGVLSYMGMNLRSADVYQYAEMKKKEGA
jgi:hypothetical protein